MPEAYVLINCDLGSEESVIDELKHVDNVKKNLISVCLIPHTVQVTNFKTKKIGDKINIETDILGKYILK